MDNLNDSVKTVYNAFVEYYGEDRIDIQKVSKVFIENTIAHNHLVSSITSCLYVRSDEYTADKAYAIIVHFPQVTVTNEYDESIVIWDLWCAIIISEEGRLLCKPLFNRTTFNKAQWLSGYRHSHIHKMHHNSTDFREWTSSCLGEGPINSTIYKLAAMGSYRENTTYYTDPIVWTLFCFELDKYTQVESLAGVPYMRLSQVIGSSSSYTEEISTFSNCLVGDTISEQPMKIVNSFLKDSIKNINLKYNYVDIAYGLAMNYRDFAIYISNLFIAWYNNLPKETRLNVFTKDYILDSGLLLPCEIQDDTICYPYGQLSSDVNFSSVDTGTTLFKFKGKDIKFNMITEETSTPEAPLLLNYRIVTYIYFTLLKIINLYYGKIIQ